MVNFFYWLHVINVLNAISTVVFILAIISFIGFGLYWTSVGFDEDESDPGNKALKGSIIAMVISGLILMFVPSKTTLLYMAGGKIAEDFIENNEKVKELPNKTVELIYSELERLTEKEKDKE